MTVVYHYRTAENITDVEQDIFLRGWLLLVSLRTWNVISGCAGMPK